MDRSTLTSLKPIISLAKRRGFIYPGSEIYGGFANTYSYGPYGSLLKMNIRNLWWKTFVEQRADIVGLDGPILLHPKAWEASGHLDHFNDALVDCRACKARFRADHLIEEALGITLENAGLEELTNIVQEKVTCPKCGASDFTKARHFNLMFATQMSKTEDTNNSLAYLRPETAQAIFLDYKQVLDTTRVKIPFGIAQIGKAFRNEITPGNFTFRTVEFEQMEIEYFISPDQGQSAFSTWLETMMLWCRMIGLRQEHLQCVEHKEEELSHYAKKTTDIVYQFPFGSGELYGLAYRGDFDLLQHERQAHVKLSYRDSKTGETFLPHVVEPTFGLDRTVLALLCDAYEEERLPNGDVRTVLHLDPKIAPVKVAVFPLMKKGELKAKAEEVFHKIQHAFPAEYDETGAIGKRYRRQDELGTPYCVTIDYDSLDDNCVTVRSRDSMLQERVPLSILLDTLRGFFS
ncbi:MAG: glycine--tRNA ligase [Chlamydiota bacterium]